MEAGLDLYLAPYGVLPTSYECGVIEVVPNSKSRSSLGELSGKFKLAQAKVTDVCY